MENKEKFDVVLGALQAADDSGVFSSSEYLQGEGYDSDDIEEIYSFDESEPSYPEGCPICGCNDIDYVKKEMDEEYAKETCKCNKCNSEWVTIYRYKDIKIENCEPEHMSLENFSKDEIKTLCNNITGEQLDIIMSKYGFKFDENESTSRNIRNFCDFISEE
jgi:predicted  nucleic acid-binding Zn-ribbon protein